MYTFVIILLGILPPALLYGAARLEGHKSMISPLKIMAATLLIGFTFKSLYIAFAEHSGSPYRARELTEGVIPIGQAVVLLATVAFLVGYVLATSARARLVIPAPSKLIPAIAPRTFYHLMFFGSVALLLVYFQKMGFTKQLLSLNFSRTTYFLFDDGMTKSSLGHLTMGADFLLIGLLYYLANSQGHRLMNRYSAAVLFSALAYFMSSKRMAVLIIIIAILLVVRAGKRNKAVLKFLRRYAFIGLGMLILAFASQIRNQGQNVSLSQLQASTAIQATFEHAMHGAYFVDPAKVTAIVLRNPEYLAGRTFLMAFIAPVPRAIWPSKPVVRLGPYVAQEILDYGNDSGAPPTAIGEFYINFGLPGVLVGMLLVGGLAGAVYRGALRSPERGNALVRYTLVMLCIAMFLIGDFTYAMMLALKYGFASVICEHYWRRRLRKQVLVTATPERPPVWNAAHL